MATPDNVSASMSRYGYPIASFDPTPITVGQRTVIADSIIWDAEYGAYRAIGRYAKKDGTASAQIAKPLMGGGEVPDNVRTALATVPGAPGYTRTASSATAAGTGNS